MFLFPNLFHGKYDILFQVFFQFHDTYRIPVFHLPFQTMFFAVLLYVLNRYIYHMFLYRVQVQRRFHDKCDIVHFFYILILFLHQKPLLQELIPSCILNHLLYALLVLDFELDLFRQKNFQSFQKYLLNLQNQIRQHRQNLVHRSLVHQSHLLQLLHFQMPHVHTGHKPLFFADRLILHLLPVLP